MPENDLVNTTMDQYADARAEVIPPPDSSPAAPPSSPAAPEPAQEPAESGTADSQAPAESAAADPAQPTPDQRRARGLQKRFDDITRRAVEAERREAMLLETMRAQATRAPQAPPEAAPDPGPGQRAPREDDYPGDFRAFLAAEARWNATQGTREEIQRDRQEQHQRVQAEQAMRQVTTVMENFSRRNEDFAAQVPDYDASVESLAEVPLTESSRPVVEALLLRPDSGRILYGFSKNIAVLKHIATLPPAAQGPALGEFAASLTTRRHSNAPPAGQPVGARSPGSSALPVGGSMDDYAAWRARQSKRTLQ